MKKKALVTLMSVVVILLAFSSGMAIDTVPLPERQRMQQTQQLKQTQQTQQLQQLQRMRMTIKAPTRIHKATTIQEARKVIPTPPTNIDSGFTYLTGLSNTSYDLTTGEIWATTINHGKLGGEFAHASSGFATSAIQNNGTSTWKNVTVKVSIQVVSGGVASFPNSPAYIFAQVGFILNGKTAGNPGVSVIPGQQYNLTCGVGDLPPGGILQGMARLGVQAQTNSGASVYGKVLSININL